MFSRISIKNIYDLYSMVYFSIDDFLCAGVQADFIIVYQNFTKSLLWFENSFIHNSFKCKTLH